MPLSPVICPVTPQYSSDVYANISAPTLVRQNNLRRALAYDYCGWGLCARPSHLEKLLNRIISRVMRRLVKSGLIIADQ